MTDLYLKTPTEEAMIAALTAAGVIDDEGNPAQDFSVDHIGPFAKVIEFTSKDEPILEQYPDWHTNLRGDFDNDQLALLTPISVQPTAPHRVWA
jgi:hypothetical protein